MAILSLTSDGLQNSLDKLKVYCDKWYLELNIAKTKIIVFNTTGRLLTTNFLDTYTPIKCTKYTTWHKCDLVYNRTLAHDYRL